MFAKDPYLYSIMGRIRLFEHVFPFTAPLDPGVLGLQNLISKTTYIIMVFLVCSSTANSKGPVLWTVSGIRKCKFVQYCCHSPDAACRKSGNSILFSHPFDLSAEYRGRRDTTDGPSFHEIPSHDTFYAPRWGALNHNPPPINVPPHPMKQENPCQASGSGATKGNRDREISH